MTDASNPPVADAGASDEVMALIRQMAEHQAGEVAAQSRQLSAADDALMKKLQKGKTSAQQKLIEAAFQSDENIALLQKSEQQKAEEEMTKKMKEPRKKKKKNKEEEKERVLEIAAASVDETMTEEEAEAAIAAAVAVLKAAKKKKKRDAQAAAAAAVAADELGIPQPADSDPTSPDGPTASPPPAITIDAIPTVLATQSSAQQAQSLADVTAAVGVDGAAEFAAMFKLVSEQQASQDLAQSRSADNAAEQLMRKLAAGKNTKQKKLIEKAFNESGLVDAARDLQQRKQDAELAARLAAGRKKKVKEKQEEEEKYPEPTPITAEPAPVVDYLEQKYGEAMAAEADATSPTKDASSPTLPSDAASLVLSNQSAIAAATSVGMSAGADGVEVAEVAAHAAALGLSPEQITAAAEAAKQIAAQSSKNGDDDDAAAQATFMALFQSATEHAAAEMMRKKSAQTNQDDAFLRKLTQGKRTKQQQMLDKQMDLIMKEQEKAKSFQSAQDDAMMKKLAAGKAKKAAAALAAAAASSSTQVEDANRLAAEALASEMLQSGDASSTDATAPTINVQDEIAAIMSAPSLLDELLAVRAAQEQEIATQAAETGLSESSILSANAEAMSVDTMAAELTLERAREAEAAGDHEAAEQFMQMYKRMIDENLSRDSALKKTLSSSEEAMMKKLMKGKTTKQQRLIEATFQNQTLVDAIMTQEEQRQQALMNIKLQAGKQRKKNEANIKAADEAFKLLRKIFLGAIKKLDASNIIRQLDDLIPLIQDGYLDLNKPIKDSGETMLHQASKYGRSEVVEWLLKFDKFIKPNSVNTTGQSPLHYAALSLDPNGVDKVSQDAAATVCMLLIEHGSDVNLSDTQSETPMTIASRLGFDLGNLANTPEALAALAAQKQKDSSAADAKEAEEVAAAEEAARLAAEAAAQIAAETAAKLAAQLAADEAAAATAAASTTQQLDPLTGLPLTTAQLQLQKEEFDSLMAEEKLEIISIVTPPPTDKKSEKTKQANLLFLQLCDLFKDLQTHPRNEQEIITLIKGNIDLVREGYLDLSKSIKNKQDGSTLLHLAVYYQKLSLVRCLLQAHADPNKTTMTGETPLHLACSLADREPSGKMIVSLLLEAGANTTIRDYKNGHIPFENAPTSALRKWMDEWKPLAERQRLALLSQMGGIDELLNKNAQNTKKAVLNAEDSFLAKLMRGKLTKQGKLVDEALKSNDSLQARTLTEQQKQLEMMQARLMKGRNKKAGGGAAMMMQDDNISLSSGSKEEQLAKKKQAFLEDMLLHELSDGTKDKIMLTAEKWSSHPNGLNGLDIQVLTKLRGMPIADAMKLLSQEIIQAESEQMRLQQAINAPGLDEAQAEEYEREYNIAECNTDIYSDLTSNMLEAEKERQQQLAEQEAQNASTSTATSNLTEDPTVRAARERLERIEAKKLAAQSSRINNTSSLPETMLNFMGKLFSEYIAMNTGYEVEPTLILQGALPMEDLRAYSLDTDTIEAMLNCTNLEEGKVFLAKQTMINEAVQGNIERILNDEHAFSSLPEQQKEETQIHQKLCESNARLYDSLMSVLMNQYQEDEPLVMQAESLQMHSEDLSLAGQQHMTEMASKEAAKLVHPDTGLSTQSLIQESILSQMRELAAEFLHLDPKELEDMTQEELQQALVKAGVNVDVMEELRKLTEAEAGIYLAKEMQRNQAESEMLKRLLKGKNLSDKKRAELLARQKQLDDAADLYNDLLSTLLTGEKKKYANMTKEEQLAQDRMLAKLAARRKKQEQLELNERLKIQEQELAIASGKVGKEVEVLDENGQPVLNDDGTVKMEMIYESSSLDSDSTSLEILEKQGVMHQLIRDNPVMYERLEALAAEHLGITGDEFKKLSVDDIQMKLVEKGVDVNILEYLKTLTNEEAAKHLAREMARAEAEAQMLRKLLLGKNLTPAEKEDLLARQRMLDENAKLYEDMLRDVLSAEQKKYANMTKEEKAAYDAMQAKLALRKAREVARAKEVQLDENSELLALFDDLSQKGQWECRVCQTSNDATNRACKFCKKSRGDTLTLSDQTLFSAHRMFHQCSCSMSVVDVVTRSIGACTKKNFVPVMQAMVVACERESNVFWDVCGVDCDNQGSLSSTASELIWGFNDWDMKNPKYHVFREAHVDETAQKYIGWTDFREECVQMPNLQDYR